MMCPCEHERYCQLRLKQVAPKQTMKESKEKMDRRTQQGVLKAMHIVDDVVGKPSTKRKTRQHAIQTVSMEGTEKCTKLPELEVPKKCKVAESVKVSEKEQKIMQVAEICGVATKALLDGVAQTVLELDMKNVNCNGASTSRTEGVC